jgi:hypothetical protein
MTRGNKKRLNKGQPLHYKKLQRINSKFIPYAYYCESIKQYVTANNISIATQKAMQTFWQRWISKKTWSMRFLEKIIYCTCDLELGRLLTDDEIKKAS